jgi:hypothetical protein
MRGTNGKDIVFIRLEGRSYNFAEDARIEVTDDRSNFCCNGLFFENRQGNRLLIAENHLIRSGIIQRRPQNLLLPELPAFALRCSDRTLVHTLSANEHAPLPDYGHTIRTGPRINIGVAASLTPPTVDSTGVPFDSIRF